MKHRLAAALPQSDADVAMTYSGTSEYARRPPPQQHGGPRQG
jgi:hypothetical protein